MSDAELVTLAVIQAMLGFTCERRWIRHARTHLAHLFPYLPAQPGYNKRLRRAAGLIRQAIHTLATDTSQWTDDVWLVDSTPVECGRSRPTTRRSELASCTVGEHRPSIRQPPPAVDSAFEAYIDALDHPALASTAPPVLPWPQREPPAGPAWRPG